MKIKPCSDAYKRLHNIVKQFIDSGDWTYAGIENTYRSAGHTSTRAVWDLWHAALAQHRVQTKTFVCLYRDIVTDNTVTDSHITTALKKITGINY